MTNREWLKSLSNEELAQFAFEKKTFLCMGCFYHYIQKELPCKEDCYIGHVKWLEAEHKEKK